MIDDFVSEQLSTEAEDGSVDKIANLLVKIFNESLVGDYTTISAVMAQTPQNGASQSKFIQSDDDDDFEIEGDEEDDVDEEDEDADDDMVILFVLSLSLFSFFFFLLFFLLILFCFKL